MKYILSVLILVVLLSSCNFNGMFLQPTKVPVNAKKLTIRTKSDTTLVAFDTITHQPSFYNTKKEPVPLDFELESVVYTSSNGHRLNGWMLKPKGQKPSITLVHLHGNAGFLLQQYQAMTPLLKYGFQAFVFDYSGYGFSEGKATRNNVLTDALSTLDYVKSRGDVKGTRLVIYGQSLGGHLSATVAAMREKDIDGLVIEGAFSSHKDIAADMVPVLGRILVKEGYASKRSVKKYHKPLLVVHSTEDETIPFYMGKRIYEAANSPKTFYGIKKCHICGPDFYPAEISAKIKKMILPEALIEYEYGSYLVNYGGCINRDSLRLGVLENGLYADQNNRLYFKTVDRSDERGNTTPVFIRRFPNDCSGAADSSYDLSKQIDLFTFGKIGRQYYRDRNNTYHFNATSDGGSFSIVYSGELIYKDAGKGFYEGSDGLLYIKTETLKDIYTDTWNAPFYRLVPDIDIATYDSFGQLDGYAKDKNSVYWRQGTTDGEFIEFIQDADAATFKVLEPRSLAKDKNHVYDQWRIVEGASPDSINTADDLKIYLKLHPGK